tara:strand:+ start:1837 stop:2412 length:576 start_codon:yes stop_codon:yes gene_type:complete
MINSGREWDWMDKKTKMIKLKDIWRNINYWPRRRWRQIKNVIGWIPVVWKQFDFDYHYSLEVFKHQLLKQAKEMESDRAIGMNSKIDAEKIRMVISLMDKVYNEEYACEYQQKLKDKYGVDVIDWVFSDILEKPDMNRLNWKYEVDEKWVDLRDQIKEDSDKWFKESHDKQERAHKLLYKLLEFYIRRWWD